MNTAQGHVLLIDDDPALSRLVERWLVHAGFEVTCATEARQGRAVLAQTLPDAVLLDVGLPDQDGLAALEAIKRAHPRVPVVMLTAQSDVETVVSAMQAGAWDYIAKPVLRPKLLTTVRNAVSKAATDLRLATLEREAAGRGYPGLIGDSPAMHELFRQLDRVGPSDITVLVRGESGTGKEVVARALHEASPRSGAPFVAINCAAIPESLQESELFGHVKGAFTGATGRRIGRFGQAHGGTLFLDEIGELSPALQAKLLRVIQERTFYPVGSDQSVDVDVRILAATHRDLREMVVEGSFREDLFYRVSVFELLVPPLRERGDDLELLARHFLTEFAGARGAGRLHLGDEARALLRRHDWPGNVRELRNAMERAAVLAEGDTVRLVDLPPGLGAAPRRALVAPPVGPLAAPLEPPASFASSASPDPFSASAPRPGVTLAQVERNTIEAALTRFDGNVSEVSRALGIPRRTLYRRLKDYGLR